jgi:hypothetical protein
LGILPDTASSIIVSPAKSAYASSSSRRACGAARATSAIVGLGIDSPVGLFGLVRKMTLVFGVIAASTRLSGKKKSDCGGTSTIRPPAASAQAAYMSNAGWTTIASNGSAAGAPRSPTSDTSRIPSSSPLVRRTLSTPTPNRAAQVSAARS